MERLNKWRLLAGIAITPQNNAVNLNSTEESYVIESVGYPVNAKYRFYLVRGAQPNDQLHDVIVEVDVRGLCELAKAAPATTPKQEQWELFPYDKKREAIKLAKQRLSKVQQSSEKLKESELITEDHFKKDDWVKYNDKDYQVVDIDKDDSGDETYTIKCPKSGKTKKVKPDALSKSQQPEDLVADIQRADESTLNYDKDSNNVTFDPSDNNPINLIDNGKEKKWANSVDYKEVKTEIPSQLDNRGDQSMGDYEKKVPVPSAIIADLTDSINQLQKELDRLGSGHTAIETAKLYKTSIGVFEEIKQHLQTGTVHSIKQAQILMTSLMSPILFKVPQRVWDFISNGGQKKSLKTYVNLIKDA